MRKIVSKQERMNEKRKWRLSDTKKDEKTEIMTERKAKRKYSVHIYIKKL
jgi:hypothetical protein